MEGQVFVVVPAGDSVPLSLVEVQVFERESISRFLEERETAVEEARKLLERKLEEGRAGLVAAREAREREIERIRARRAAIKEEKREFLEQVSDTIEDYRQRILANEAFIIDLDETPQAPEGIPTRQEFAAYSERLERWYSMARSEREAWQVVLKGQNEDLESAIAEQRAERAERLESWEVERKELAASIETHDEAVVAAERALREVEAERRSFPSVADYFEGLPNPELRVRTDANGEFTLVLSRNRPAALVARVNREIRGNREQHAWLLWLDPAKQEPGKILLSNHNSMDLQDAAETLAVTTEGM